MQLKKHPRAQGFADVKVKSMAVKDCRLCYKQHRFCFTSGTLILMFGKILGRSHSKVLFEGR